VSDDAARTADGRLFHARGAATENDRSPTASHVPYLQNIVESDIFDYCDSLLCYNVSRSVKH